MLGFNQIIVIFDSGNGERVSRINKRICTGVTQELCLLLTYCHVQGDTNFQLVCFNCCGSSATFSLSLQDWKYKQMCRKNDTA